MRSGRDNFELYHRHIDGLVFMLKVHLNLYNKLSKKLNCYREK